MHCHAKTMHCHANHMTCCSQRPRKPLDVFPSLRVGSGNETKFRAKRGLYLGPIEVCMASLRVSKTFLAGTRTLALSTGASVLDIRGLHSYSLAGLNSPC